MHCFLRIQVAHCACVKRHFCREMLAHATMACVATRLSPYVGDIVWPFCDVRLLAPQTWHSRFEVEQWTVAVHRILLSDPSLPIVNSSLDSSVFSVCCSMLMGKLITKFWFHHCGSPARCSWQVLLLSWRWIHFTRHVGFITVKRWSAKTFIYKDTCSHKETQLVKNYSTIASIIARFEALENKTLTINQTLILHSCQLGKRPHREKGSSLQFFSRLGAIYFSCLAPQFEEWSHSLHSLFVSLFFLLIWISSQSHASHAVISLFQRLKNLSTVRLIAVIVDTRVHL